MRTIHTVLQMVQNSNSAISGNGSEWDRPGDCCQTVWKVRPVRELFLRTKLNQCSCVLSRPRGRGRTNVHYLVFHLTLADSIICYVVLPMETLWRLTIEWHAGNPACKILMMCRTGGFILSSAILVVISIDRSVFHHHAHHHFSSGIILLYNSFL